jgi:hypothetical protein
MGVKHMNLQMKVGNLLRRLLPAFESIPRDLFTKSGLDFDGLVKCDVVSVEVVYSLEPLPPNHKVDFLLHPQLDGAKVTLGVTDGRKQDETTQVLPT